MKLCNRLQEHCAALSLFHIMIIVGGLSALSLVMANVAEYGFGLLPCELCLMQRKPFFVVIGLAGMGILYTVYSSTRHTRDPKGGGSQRGYLVTHEKNDLSVTSLDSRLRGNDKTKNTQTRLLPLILLLMGITLFINAGIAFFHTGVEQHWWQGLTSCSSDDANTQFSSLEELRAHILAAPLIRCDVPAWEFHGITMASLNVIFSALLGAFALWGVFRNPQPSLRNEG
jgi:disulfide bond formation protein DsbB